MEFLTLSEKEIRQSVSNINYNDLKDFIKFIKINHIEDISKHHLKLDSIRKSELVHIISGLFMTLDFRERLYTYLMKDKKYSEIYYDLIWKNAYISTGKYKLNLVLPPFSMYNEVVEKIGLLTRRTNFNYHYEVEYDTLELDSDLRQLLKTITPLPDNYHIKSLTHIEETEFTYNNENNILDFIDMIESMLENNLLAFGKTTEKPLLKTLNLLKSSTGTNEFYTTKKLNTFATDMLTRSFYFYYKKDKSKKKPLTKLKKFIELQLRNQINFTISRIVASHLKKIKFGVSYQQEKELFSIIKDYIYSIPKNEWVSIDNLLDYSAYRDSAFYYENSWKIKDYYMETDSDNLYVNNFYEDLYFNPIIKGMFFYLASLGVVELKYNTPSSSIKHRGKGVDYISVWDELKYIKLTELGKYIFGFSTSYTPKKRKKQENTLKFDEYKPIITVDPKDVISLAKIEEFTEKYDTNQYILSYSKIFKDCKSYKLVIIKIERFYTQIEANPPEIFQSFFDSIKKRANKLKRDLKQVVINLDNNKELLNLFMTNKKLQALIIKAQGYRIIVEKTNIPKLTKIVKDNGFFVDF